MFSHNFSTFTYMLHQPSSRLMGVRIVFRLCFEIHVWRHYTVKMIVFNENDTYIYTNYLTLLIERNYLIISKYDLLNIHYSYP